MFSDFMAAALLEILFKLAKLSRDGTIDQLISDQGGTPPMSSSSTWAWTTGSLPGHHAAAWRWLPLKWHPSAWQW